MRTLDYLLDAFVERRETPAKPLSAERTRRLKLSLPATNVPLFHVWRP
jgi:hypothetical protein